MNYYELSMTYGGVQPKDKSGTMDFATFVTQRYNAMAVAKIYIRQAWEGTQDLYYCNDWEWIVSGEGWDRSVRFPTLRDTTKSLVDNFMKDPPDVDVQAKKDSEKELAKGKKAYIERMKDSIHEKKVRRMVFEDMFFYGKGLRGVSYYDIYKEDIPFFNEIATNRIDPRHFFVDENATTLHDKTGIIGARDVIYRKTVPLSVFMQMAKDKGWSTEDVLTDAWYQSLGLDFLVTNQREILEKAPVKEVKLYEYMNQSENIYGIVANGKSIYQSTLKKAKGSYRIPVADYSFEPRNDSFWGNNLGMLLAPHIYLKDTLINLEIMNLKLTLQPVIAVSGEFGYNKKIHQLQPGGVWQASGLSNGKIQDNFQTVIAGNPNTKVYEMLQNINSEMTVSSRSDNRALEYYKGKTATEVMTQGNSANAHNETIENITEVESEAVLYEIVCDLMKEFMRDKDKLGQRKRIPIKDHVAVRNESNAEFMFRRGFTDFFEMTEDMIGVDVDVVVTDKRSAIAKNAEKMGRILQAIPIIGNMAQLNPQEVLRKIDLLGLLEQLCESVGLDVDRCFKSDDNEYVDEFKNIKEEILLGHKIDVPIDETRDESRARLKFLMDIRLAVEDLPLAQKAWQYHFEKTAASVIKTRVPQPPEQALQGPPVPNGMINNPQAGGPPIGSGGQGIPQPNDAMLASNNPSLSTQTMATSSANQAL